MGIGSFLLGNTLGQEDGERRGRAEADAERSRRIQSEAQSREHSMDFVMVAAMLKKQLIVEKQKNKVLRMRFLIERRERDGYMHESYAKTRTLRQYIDSGQLNCDDVNASLNKWRESPEVDQDVKIDVERLNPLLEANQ